METILVLTSSLMQVWREAEAEPCLRCFAAQEVSVKCVWLVDDGGGDGALPVG